MDDRLPPKRATDTALADSLPYPDASGDRGLEPDHESPPSTPRWVKASAILAIVLVLLFVGLHLTGNTPMHSMASGGAMHGMQAP